MTQHILSTLTAMALAAVASAPVAAEPMTLGAASLSTADGEAAGIATLTETPHGILLTAELHNLPAGEHGFHIHETGACKPDFGAAGEHLNPGETEHGFANPNGYHLGDMPNVFVADDGAARVHVFLVAHGEQGALDSIFDEDGSALIVHADADTYGKEAGAGDRIACGVIEASE